MPDAHTPDLDALWTTYHASPDDAARNALAVAYQPLVWKNAERVHSRVPRSVQVDDLVSAGNVGLLDAIESFRTDKGARFTTYARFKIRSAILDYLREIDWVPRGARSRSKRYAAAVDQLRAAKGKDPTPAEIRRHLKMSADEFRIFMKDHRATAVYSQDANMRGLQREEFEGRDAKVSASFRSRGSGPFAATARRDLRDFVTQSLNRAERLIVVLYYYEGMTMKEIGATLDLSESRVSQVHTSICERLRARLSADDVRGVEDDDA